MADKTLMDSNRENARRNASGRLIKEDYDITGTDDRDELDRELQRSQQLNQQFSEQRAKIKGTQELGTESRGRSEEANRRSLGQRALVGRYRDESEKLENPKSVDICFEPETGYKEANVALRVTKSGALITAQLGDAGISIAATEFTEIV